MKEYIVPVLAIVGGFSLALAAFKWSQGYMGANGQGVKGIGRFGFGGRRMGVVLTPQSTWEKNKMAQGILMTLG